MHPADTIAWGACVFSTLVPLRFAQVFLRQSPRLFTALSLFAMVWALLLPYYGGTSSSELFAGFGGFLSVFVGTLLVREARIEAGERDLSVSAVDRFSLWMLPVIAAPTALTVALPAGRTPILTYDELEVVWSTAITLLGLFAISNGLGYLLPERQWRAVLVCATVYAILEVTYMVAVVDFRPKADGAPTPPMPDHFKYLYAAAKTIYSPLVTYYIAFHGMSEKDRKIPMQEKLLRLIGI